MESPNEIRKHIEVLIEFEAKYREFVHALEEEVRSGRPYWHKQAFEQKKRDILEAAPRADVAAKASGKWLETHGPPALGERTISEDLSAQVLDYGLPGFTEGNDGLDTPHAILNLIPTQIGALRLNLEKAEAAKKGRRRSWTDSTPGSKSWTDPGPMETQPLPVAKESPSLTGIHLSVLLLPFAVFGTVYAATHTVLWSVAASAAVLALLFVRPIRNPLLRGIDRVVGS